MDRRRRQWIPMSADFPFDTTGTRLLEEFGNDGVAVWTAFLTACKRSPIQGRISYGSEAEGWAQLGLDPSESFTLDDVWRVTGQLKKTRRTRRGRLTNVISTTWEEWNDTHRSQVTREQNARSKAVNAQEEARNYRRNVAEMRSTESESERDSESDIPPKAPAVPSLPEERKAREWCEIRGIQPTPSVLRHMIPKIREYISTSGDVPTRTQLEEFHRRGIKTPGGWGWGTARDEDISDDEWEAIAKGEA